MKNLTQSRASFRPLLVAPVFAFLAAASAFGQWSAGSNGAIYYNGGNVSIGTSSADAPLFVDGLIHTSGNDAPTFVGQGAYFGWNASYPWTGWLGETDFMNYSPAPGGFAFFNVPYGGSLSAPLMFISGGGNVGIGTTNPQKKLSVHGTIQAEEVIVNTGWSDYVFDPNYHLPSLEEVSDYVTREHHLPGIQSRSEVEKNGVSLGEVQSQLLAKVEELTLQMIQLNQKNKQLEHEVAELKAKR